MTLRPPIARISIILGMSALILLTTFYALPPVMATSNVPPVPQPAVGSLHVQNSIAPTLSLNALITPTNGITVDTPWPTFDWLDATSSTDDITYTLIITGGGSYNIWRQLVTATVVVTDSIYTATIALPNDAYTWTVSAEDAIGQSSFATPGTFVVDAGVVFPDNPLLAPADGLTLINPLPAFDWLDASQPMNEAVTYTLLITSSGVATNVWGQTTTATVVLSQSAYIPNQPLVEDTYTWTVEAYDTEGRRSQAIAPFTFVLTKGYTLKLPALYKPGSTTSDSLCPTTSSNVFELIPIEGAPADHPGPLHGDLNLGARGYVTNSETLALIDISGSTDGNAPQLDGLFNPHRLPTFATTHQVNGWDWGCGTHGCPTSPVGSPSVTMIGMDTTEGESIFIPTRSPEIYGGGYIAMVLYAEEQRITLNYLRADTVADGYSVHIENVCVDANLLALYQAQVDSEGWHMTGQLPALRNDQALGTAPAGAIQVVIRDRGTFMDPRSRKDWWMGY